MANEMLFMKLSLKGKPVPGDSVVKGYEGQIQLKSLKWGLGVKDRGVAASAEKTTKNWDPKELRLSKYLDGATTALFNHMDERKELHSSTPSLMSKAVLANTAVISLVGVSALKTGEKMPVLMVVTANRVRIKSISSNASEGGSFLSLNEDLVLAYKDLKIDYFPAGKGSARGAMMSFKFEGEDD